MGKNLRQQRRGKGTSTYRAGKHGIGQPRYGLSGEATVLDIVHAPGRKLPLAVVEMDGEKKLMIASGDMVTTGIVDVRQLSDIPEGSKIHNIEIRPGDGGKICRTSGTFATMVTRSNDKCVILLPSKQKKILPGMCRAVEGICAGAGRKEKPFMKAGTRHHAMKAQGKLYPHTRGVAMNAVDHPFGGKTRPGKTKTVSRDMPPGKKVGSISARRSGLRKRK